MYQKEFDACLHIIKLASEVISQGYFDNGGVSIKSDGSPVTEIDKKVDKLIRDYLAKEFNNYGFLTEESKDDLSRLEREFIWIIDPIDGTMEFINHEYEFVTNIALCKNHEIVLSMISVPLKDEIYYAIKGEGAYLIKDGVTTKIHVNNKLSDLTYLSSPYHMSKDEENFINNHKDKFNKMRLAGAAYKACLIAKGEAEISYRLTVDTKEWDTAAPDLLIREAGGVFFDRNKLPLKYNRQDVRNLDGFIMLNRIENYFE